MSNCTKLRSLLQELLSELDHVCPVSLGTAAPPKGKSRAANPYAQCVGQHMKEIKPENPTQRKREFCIASKVCSGKAEEREEAENLCSLAHPEWFIYPRQR